MSQGTITCPYCGESQTVSDIAAIKHASTPTPMFCSGCGKGLSKACILEQIQAQARRLIEAALEKLNK